MCFVKSKIVTAGEIKHHFYFYLRGVLKIGIPLVLSLLERGRERLYKKLFQFLEVLLNEPCIPIASGQKIDKIISVCMQVLPPIKTTRPFLSAYKNSKGVPLGQTEIRKNS